MTLNFIIRLQYKRCHGCATFQTYLTMCSVSIADAQIQISEILIRPLIYSNL